MSQDYKIAYISLLIVSCFWLTVILSAPWVVSWGPFAGKLYYTFFKGLCHQIPDRSFFLHGVQLPVCVRCFGIYSGVFVSLILYPVFKKISLAQIPSWKWLGCLVAPIILDGISQTMHLYKSPAEIRYATGFLAGYAVIILALPVLNKVLKSSIWCMHKTKVD